MANQAAPGRYANVHVRQHESNPLKPADGLAERAATTGIGDGFIPGPPRQAHSLGAQKRPAGVKGLHDGQETASAIAQHVGIRHGTVLKLDAHGRSCLLAHLGDGFTANNARGIRTHKEATETLVALIGIGDSEHRQPRGGVAAGNPQLRSVEHPPVSLAGGRRLQGGHVGPRLRLGNAERHDLALGQDARQPCRLLVFRSGQQQWQEPQFVDGESSRDSGATVTKLLVADGCVQHGQAASAIPDRHNPVGQAGLGSLLEQGTGVVRNPVPFDCRRNDQRLGEFPVLFLDLVLLGSQFQIHRWVPMGCDLAECNLRAGRGPISVANPRPGPTVGMCFPCQAEAFRPTSSPTSLLALP